MRKETQRHGGTEETYTSNDINKVALQKWLNMKNIIFLLLLPILFSACGDDGPGFDMSYRQDFEIPAGLNTFDIHGREFSNIPTNKNSFFTANNVTESDVTAITPREARLSINFGDEDLYFVREVIVEILTKELDEEGNPRWKEIYFRENVPLNTGQSIQLLPSLPQVTEELTSDEFSVRVEMLFRDITPTFIDARLEMIFLAKY